MTTKETKREASRKKRVKRRPAALVYVLGCFTKKRHWTYVGWTNDLERRLAAHNSGKGARSTRGRVWVLLYSERHPTRQKAMSREWHLKRDRKFRQQLVIEHRSMPARCAPI